VNAVMNLPVTWKGANHLTSSVNVSSSLKLAKSRDLISSQSHLYLGIFKGEGDRENHPVSLPHCFSIGVEQCTGVSSFEEHYPLECDAV
jgi:hypothetical protein